MFGVVFKKVEQYYMWSSSSFSPYLQVIISSEMTISKILKLSIFELTSDQYQVRNLNKSVTNWYGL